MERKKYLQKMMTQRQKEIYAQIIDQKIYVAKGTIISTCKVLMQLGLIKNNPESDSEKEFVLNGKPLNIPYAEKLPLAKDIIKEISEKKIIPFAPEPKLQRPPATYSNVSREQHVEKWINANVPTKKNRIGYNQQKKTA